MSTDFGFHCKFRVMIGMVLLLVFAAMPFASKAIAATSEVFDGKILRGINVDLFTNPTEEDFKKIHSWGANSIRLVMREDLEQSGDEPWLKGDHLLKSCKPFAVDEDALKKLEQAVELAGKNGLSVILDMHTWPGRSDGKIWRDFSYWECYIKLWEYLAAHFKGNPAIIGYDLMNEPNWLLGSGERKNQWLKRIDQWKPPAAWKDTPRDYLKLMEKVASAIRKNDPNTTIIVEGAGSGGKPFNFKWLKPISVNNVVYSFHMYVPGEFSHQGSAEQPGEASYPSPSFGRADVNRAMEDVIAFERKYNVPIYVGEFGTTKGAEGRGVDQWMTDVLNYFEKQHWSWSYWSYSWPGWAPETPAPGRATSQSDRLTTLKKFWKLNGTP